MSAKETRAIPPMGRGRAHGKAPKPKNVKATISRLMQYLTKRHKASMIIVCICIVFSSLAGVAGSLFLRVLIDNYITPLMGQTNPVLTGLMGAIIAMAGIYIVGMASTLTYNLIMVSVAQGIMKEIRDEMFAKMQRLPVKYFDTNNFGDIMSRYTNDTDTLRQLLTQSIPQIIATGITLVAVFVSMVVTSWLLTLVVFCFLGIMFFIVKTIGGKSSTYFVAQQRSLGSTNGYIEEMINGQKVIKVFCHEDEAKDGFDKLNEELRSNATNANTFANILMPIMGNLGHLQYVVLAIVGGALAISGFGGLTLGAIVTFLQLSRSFVMPISQASQQINMIVMALAGAERIFEMMDATPEADNGYVTLVNAKYVDGELTETAERTNMWAWKHPHGDGTLTYTRLQGKVQFFDVDFAYEEGKTVLHDVTLYAEPGQKVAFVGATGAGKTTITNLINRFYDIEDGKIRYDDININKIKKDDLRRSLGIVLQDTNLFTGTIKDNIKYGNLDATDEEVIAAAKLANAHDFISRLPKGYDTEISGDGSGLSQGQRQLLSIARAAVANAPVMILDEATSSIDTRTEALVQKGTDRLMEGRTVFVIAHRLSTVQNSDVILVLEQGRIIERGSHEKLIEERGKYYQLYTGAFELE